MPDLLWDSEEVRAWEEQNGAGMLTTADLRLDAQAGR